MFKFLFFLAVICVVAGYPLDGETEDNGVAVASADSGNEAPPPPEKILSEQDVKVMRDFEQNEKMTLNFAMLVLRLQDLDRDLVVKAVTDLKMKKGNMILIYIFWRPIF